ncbi:hypothetical protein MSG28_012754 [Choristoneura fumiferana]|uniref:Uncharacterized protein n=1 Tax=Choristoneura fumiferana TaxID=7141 RepID=A0ACC0JHX6_CHOFU|nr:hypothetical protein MSG28_012754 [Choristoneura fumiferana]
MVIIDFAKSENLKPTVPSSDLAAAIAGCGCSKIYDPVCASSDKSYYNPCQMECEVGTNSAIYIKHQGNCVPY